MMKIFRRNIFNRNGFSLFEVMVSLGVLGALTFGVTSTLKNQNKTSHSSKAKLDTSIYANSIQYNLFSNGNNATAVCGLTFDGQSQNADGNIVISKAQANASGLIRSNTFGKNIDFDELRLENARFEGSIPGSTSRLVSYTAVIRFVKTGAPNSIIGANNLERKLPVPVLLHMTNAGTVLKCMNPTEFLKDKSQEELCISFGGTPDGSNLNNIQCEFNARTNTAFAAQTLNSHSESIETGNNWVAGTSVPSSLVVRDEIDGATLTGSDRMEIVNGVLRIESGQVIANYSVGSEILNNTSASARSNYALPRGWIADPSVISELRIRNTSNSADPIALANCSSGVGVGSTACSNSTSCASGSGGFKYTTGISAGGAQTKGTFECNLIAQNSSCPFGQEATMEVNGAGQVLITCNTTAPSYNSYACTSSGWSLSSSGSCSPTDNFCSGTSSGNATTGENSCCGTIPSSVCGSPACVAGNVCLSSAECGGGTCQSAGAGSCSGTYIVGGSSGGGSCRTTSTSTSVGAGVSCLLDTSTGICETCSTKTTESDCNAYSGYSDGTNTYTCAWGGGLSSSSGSSTSGSGSSTDPRCSGGGPYRTCFLENTMITMANGERKPIQDVKEGDFVKTLRNGVYEGETYLSARVDKAMKSINKGFKYGINWKEVNGRGVFVTGGHPFMTIDGSWKAFEPENAPVKERVELNLKKLRLGDILVREDGIEAIVAFRKELTSELVYNFEVNGVHEYIAEGYRVHNKVACNPTAGYNCGGSNVCVDGNGYAVAQGTGGGTCSTGICSIGSTGGPSGGGSGIGFLENCSGSTQAACEAPSPSCTWTPAGGNSCVCPTSCTESSRYRVRIASTPGANQTCSGTDVPSSILNNTFVSSDSITSSYVIGGARPISWSNLLRGGFLQNSDCAKVYGANSGSGTFAAGSYVVYSGDLSGSSDINNKAIMTVATDGTYNIKKCGLTPTPCSNGRSCVSASDCGGAPNTCEVSSTPDTYTYAKSRSYVNNTPNSSGGNDYIICLDPPVNLTASSLNNAIDQVFTSYSTATGANGSNSQNAKNILGAAGYIPISPTGGGPGTGQWITSGSPSAVGSCSSVPSNYSSAPTQLTTFDSTITISGNGVGGTGQSIPDTGIIYSSSTYIAGPFGSTARSCSCNSGGGPGGGLGSGSSSSSTNNGYLYQCGGSGDWSQQSPCSGGTVAPGAATVPDYIPGQTSSCWSTPPDDCLCVGGPFDAQC